MRLVHVITGLGVGGSEMMLLRILERRDSATEHVVISLTSGGALKSQIEALGVRVHELSLSGVSGPLTILRLRRLLVQLKPQVVQGWMYHANLAASLVMQTIDRSVPVYWGIHCTLDGERSFGSLTDLLMRLGARLSKLPRRTVYVAETALTQHVAAGYCAQNTMVIPVGVDCNLFQPDAAVRVAVRQELGVPDDTLLVGMLARYHPGKDHASLLEAMALTSSHAKSGGRIQLVLAGTNVTDGNPELRSHIDALKIGAIVSLLGPRKDANRLMAALDVYCSTSVSEACPTVLIEALASGVPCVATDAGDSWRIVADSGQHAAMRQPASVAAGIEALLALDAGSRQTLGQKGRRRMLSEFSLASVVSAYQSLWNAT